MTNSAGAVQNGLVLRLSVPASGELAALGPELATRLAEQLGVPAPQTTEVATAIGSLSSDVGSPGAGSVEFEFHVSDWLRDSSKGQPVAPELARIRENVLCVWGEDDKDSLCNGLAQANVHVVTLKGAHHFDGGYEKLAKIILDELP